jgi:hypothetical protein
MWSLQPSKTNKKSGRRDKKPSSESLSTAMHRKMEETMSAEDVQSWWALAGDAPFNSSKNVLRKLKDGGTGVGVVQESTLFFTLKITILQSQYSVQYPEKPLSLPLSAHHVHGSTCDNQLRARSWLDRCKRRRSISATEETEEGTTQLALYLSAKPGAPEQAGSPPPPISGCAPS